MGLKDLFADDERRHNLRTESALQSLQHNTDVSLVSLSEVVLVIQHLLTQLEDLQTRLARLETYDGEWWD